MHFELIFKVHFFIKKNQTDILKPSCLIFSIAESIIEKDSPLETEGLHFKIKLLTL